MKSRRKQFQLWALMLILSLSTLGCASPYSLMKRKATLGLQSNEGIVLFSCKFNNKDKPEQKNVFRVASLTLQEVNQYKAYGNKKWFFIPSPNENYIKQDDLFLFSLKLPRGTYKMVSLNGIQSLLGVNRLFDVAPERISYAGRMEIGFFVFEGRQTHEIKIEDKIDEDQGRFKNGYPVLQNRTIIKDIVY